MKNIGQALRQHRELAGLSQSQLAKKTGLPQTSISRWENNGNPPNVEDCIVLAKFYGITIEELLDIDDEN